MRKILNSEQIRKADAYTIANEPILSIDLMERASSRFVLKFKELYPNKNRPIVVLCGPGNNGGDGFAIARMLHKSAYLNIQIYYIAFSANRSNDNLENHNRLIDLGLKIKVCDDDNVIHDLNTNAIVIDAVLGSGLNSGLRGLPAKIAQRVNQHQLEVVAVDVPTGFFPEGSFPGSLLTVKCKHCITFQRPKLNFFLPESARHIGAWHVVDIGLDEMFIEAQQSAEYYTTRSSFVSFIESRGRFSHKGNFGHALLFAGSTDKFGACIMTAVSALRSGLGLLTCHIPSASLSSLNLSLPEAMVSLDEHQNYLSSVPNIDGFSAIAAGPGIGSALETQNAIHKILRSAKVPLVLDADALNCIAEGNMQNEIPANSVLTPHMKEFDRLFGEHDNWWDRIATARRISTNQSIFIVLKNAYTIICSPDGRIVFNTSGNPGMAKGGSGDVLTGVLMSIVAQKGINLENISAAVYIHGLAADLATEVKGEVSLLASDIIACLPKAFHSLSS